MSGKRLLSGVSLLAAALAAPWSAAQPLIAEYRASYEVRHDGRRAADAEFSVVATGSGEYLYGSVTEARGLLRIIAPNPATERSRMRIAGNGLKSLQFDYVDGSRKGEDNFSIAFDAAAGQVRITRADGAQTLPYEPDLLDRGSLQVAVMRDLAACRLPGPYRWVDEDGVRTYRYERLEDARADTEAGTFATMRFSQQREGSSRQSILWLAPEQSFVPVIVEQIDDGEVKTVFSLTEIAVATPPAATCSGFR